MLVSSFIVNLTIWGLPYHVESTTECSAATQKPRKFLSLNTDNGDLIISIGNFRSDSQPLLFDFETVFSNRPLNFDLLHRFNARRVSRDVPIEQSESTSIIWDNEFEVNANTRQTYVYPDTFPVAPPHRKVMLKHEEDVSKSIKIWQIDIWDRLVASLRKHPDHIYNLYYSDNIPVAINLSPKELCLVIDVHAIENLKKLQSAFIASQNKEDSKVDRSGSISSHVEGLVAHTNYYRLILAIENPFDTVYTVDLEQPFLQGFKISTLSPPSIARLTGATIRPNFQEYRVIDLEEGESFRRSFDIRELAIWPEIQASFAKSSQQSVEISNEIRCWVDGKEFVCPVKWVLDKATFQTIAR